MRSQPCSISLPSPSRPPFLFFFSIYAPVSHISTLSLHDALPISEAPTIQVRTGSGIVIGTAGYMSPEQARGLRSEEHTSELQSPCNLVCRLLLEIKKGISSV